MKATYCIVNEVTWDESRGLYPSKDENIILCLRLMCYVKPRTVPPKAETRSQIHNILTEGHSRTCSGKFFLGALRLESLVNDYPFI